MVEQRDGWFVINVRDARWYRSAAFGKVAIFEEPERRFPQTGVRLYVLEPGKPNCRYHREEAQENFLVLSGECLLLVNDQRQRLKSWDFVHCPAGVSHVFVGDGDGPCTLLAIGHRPPERRVWYPRNELARGYGAETPQSTADHEVAYADVPEWEPSEPGSWVID